MNWKNVFINAAKEMIAKNEGYVLVSFIKEMDSDSSTIEHVEIIKTNEIFKLQESIRFYPKNEIYYHKNGKERDIKEILRDIENTQHYTINVCIRVIEKLKEQTYLASLFDKKFLLKLTSKNNLSYDFRPQEKYQWICVEDTLKPNNIDGILIELSDKNIKKDILKHLI